jgi:Nif-specific regulatory protein
MAQDRDGAADFYERLLDLGTAEEPEPLLVKALETIVTASGAQMAYIELHDYNDERRSDAPMYWRAHGCSDEEIATIRASISRGIVARTLAEGRMVETPSAVSDPEFQDHPSVLRNAIQAVLCAPIGAPAFGVVYLQGAGDGFVAGNRKPVKTFARQLATVADRLLLSRLRDATDQTTELRKRFRCDGIVGRSAAIARVLQESAEVAPTAITVLLLGAPGTGKTALARTISANGPRAAGAFVDLNCASLPESLLEAELFGAEQGSYTGATRKMLGKVAAARGGTLFLDEIGELSLGAQAKLLQLLNDKRYYPIGGTTPITADVRVISATNADLTARVKNKTFRDDLYWRLAVVKIVMPSLDDRREDIPDMVERFCVDACRRIEGPPLRPTRRALFACREASWPGNVRELANAIEAAVMRARYENANAIEEHHVFPQNPRSDDKTLTFRQATQRFQRRYVQDLLAQHNWNITRCAEDLDITRQHLHALITTFGLSRPKTDAESE